MSLMITLWSSMTFIILPLTHQYMMANLPIKCHQNPWSALGGVELMRFLTCKAFKLDYNRLEPSDSNCIPSCTHLYMMSNLPVSFQLKNGTEEQTAKQKELLLYTKVNKI